MTAATVQFDGDSFVIRCRFFDNERASGLPDRKWNAELKCWQAPSNKQNAEYIKSQYTAEEIKPMAWREILDLTSEEEQSKFTDFPVDHVFKNQPRPYQMDGLNRAYWMREFALFMEMRTGKSFVDINLAAAYYNEGLIDAYLIVMFPGAIKMTWKIQLEEHMPIPYDLHVLTSGKSDGAMRFIDAPSDKLKIMIIGIESLSQGKGGNLMQRFVDKHKVKFTIDESTCIKNPKALTAGKVKKPTRVKKCWDAGADCEFRMIMTGTPVTQGIEDLYSQFRFLNWRILGYKSFFAYKAAHCIVGGFQAKKIIGYHDTEQIIAKVTPHVYQISTKNAIGIPEEVLEMVVVEQTVEQKRLLVELGDPLDMSTYLGDDELKVKTILERMIRYQQIVGGHFPYGVETGFAIKALPSNPKLDGLKGIIEILPKTDKAIIWARFVPEIKAIVDMITAMGETCVSYRGGMSDDDRERAQRTFMEADGPRFWVASQQASARGVELAAASVHIYYSNSFSYDDRKQSEMRTNSSHQKAKSILYIDIVMNHKIDKQIIEALRYKRDIAEYVTEEIEAYQQQR